MMKFEDAVIHDIIFAHTQCSILFLVLNSSWGKQLILNPNVDDPASHEGKKIVYDFGFHFLCLKMSSFPNALRTMFLV